MIKNSEQITVTLKRRITLPAKVVGRDVKADLALLKVVPQKPLTRHAISATSDKARIGDWVIAIGDHFRDRASDRAERRHCFGATATCHRLTYLTISSRPMLRSIAAIPAARC